MGIFRGSVLQVGRQRPIAAKFAASAPAESDSAECGPTKAPFVGIRPNTSRHANASSRAERNRYPWPCLVLLLLRTCRTHGLLLQGTQSKVVFERDLESELHHQSRDCSSLTHPLSNLSRTAHGHGVSETEVDESSPSYTRNNPNNSSGSDQRRLALVFPSNSHLIWAIQFSSFRLNSFLKSSLTSMIIDVTSAIAVVARGTDCR